MKEIHEIIKLGEAWFQEDSKHRNAVIIVSDGIDIQSGTSGNAVAIANMLLSLMPDNAELREGVRLAAKLYDSLGASQHEEKTKPDGKKVLS